MESDQTSNQQFVAGPPVNPNRGLRRWLWTSVVAVVMLSGLGYAAAKVLGKNPAPQPRSSPAVQSPVSGNESTKIGTGPVASTQLSVTTLTAQDADLATLLAKALQVTGDAQIQGNLTVGGSGTFGGNLAAANFTGSGASLTNVNAALLNGKPGSFYSNLASGVADAALKGSPNTFTDANTFNGGLNSTTITSTGAATFDGPTTLGGATTIANLNLTAPLTVDNGGTGLTNVPAASVLYGQGGPTLGVATPAGAGLCLLSGTTDVQWGACSGAAAGVAMLNGLTGALSVANATGVGSTITINDASTSQKGIAQFNATNFTAAGGVINAIQDIATTSAPSFGQLSLTSAQAAADMLTVNNTNAGATGNLINLKLNGSSKFSVAASGNATIAGTLSSGTINGQTISNAASFTGSLGVSGLASFNNGATVTGTLTSNSLSPTGALTVGATGQQFTLQGNAGSTITATGGGFTTTVGFAGSPSGAVTYNFDRSALPGTYSVCTSVGNCAGAGGGVTTPGGTAGKIAKFTAGSTIANSSISDNGTSVSVTPASDGATIFQVQNAAGRSLLNVDTSANQVTLGNITASAGQGVVGVLVLADGTADNFGVKFNPATLTGNRTITVPNAAGTLAVSASGPLALDAAGNLTCPTCVTSGGGGGGVGAVDSVDLLTGALSIANSSGVGTTISINDASTAQKGIAQFNSTNFSASGGTVNTIQDIATTSAPSFGQLTITSSQAANAMLVVNNTNAGASGNLLDLKLNGTSEFSVTPVGLATAKSLTVTGTITGNTVTPTGALTVGASGQAFTLQGTGGSAITATTSGQVTTVGFSGTPAGAVTYNFDQAATPGTYTVCTTSGNCAGAAGANTALSNLSSVAINTSLLPGAAGTVNLGSGALPFGQLFVAGTSGTPATNNFDITGASTSGTRTITLPDASGTVCLQNSASCGFALSSSGVTQLNSLVGNLSIANATGSGSTITIQDAAADGSTKGIATFNSTNFQASGGVINTTQNINSGATPTFVGVDANSLNPSAALTVGATGQQFTLQGTNASTVVASNGTNTTTLGFQNPIANVVYQLQAAAAGTYQICTTAGNCLGGGGGGANTALSNLTGVAINTSLLPATAGTVNLGSGTLPFGHLFVAGASGTPGTNNFDITGTSTGGTRTITLPDASGTVCLQTSSACGFESTTGTDFIQNQNASAQTANFNITGTGTATGYILANGANRTINVQTASSGAGNNLTIQAGTGAAGTNAGGNLVLAGGASTGGATGGSVIVKPQTDSTTAFQIQNASGAQLLSADTTNSNVTANGNFITPNGGFGMVENILGYSEQFLGDSYGNWWTPRTSLNVSADSTTAPNGATTADTLVGTANTSTIVQSAPSPGNGTYTFSVWLKQVSGAATTGLCIFTDTGTPASCTPTAVTPSSTTWQRFSVTQVVSGSPAHIEVEIEPGNGAAPTSVYAWGAQLVQGSAPGVYLPTTFSTVDTPDYGMASGDIYGTGGFLTGNVQVAAAASPSAFLVTDEANTLFFQVDTANSIVSSTADTLQEKATSATALLVQNVGGNNLLAVDTSGNNVAVGATGSTALASTVNIATSSSSSNAQIVSVGSSANASSTVTVEAGTGASAIQIGNGATAHGIQIGTGAAAQTIAVGSTNTTSATTISSGSGNINLKPGTGSVIVGNGSATPTLSFDNNNTAGLINFSSASSGVGNSLTVTGQTGAAASNGGTVLVQGGTAGTTGTGGTATLQGGTAAATAGSVGGIAAVKGAAGTSTGTGAAGGAVQITGGNAGGSGANAGGAISLTAGSSTGAGTGGNVSLDAGSGTNIGSILIGSTNDAAITLGKSTGVKTITVGQSTAGNTINIGNAAISSGIQAINIGTGSTSTGVDTLNIGSGNAGSTTSIQGGSGGLSLLTGASSSTSGSIIIQTGSSLASSGGGNILIDTGKSVAIGGGTLGENDTFESGVGTWVTWFPGGGGGESVAITGAQFRTGSKSLAITTGGGSWGVQTTGSGQIATPGQSYTVSLWLRDSANTQNIDTEVGWGGTSITSNLPSVSINSSTWTQVTGTVVAPVGATNLVIFVSNQGDNDPTVYIDDVTVTGNQGAPVLLVGANNADTVTLGNANESGATTIQGGSGGITLATASDTVLVGDSVHNRLVVGNAAASSGANTTLFVLDSATTTNAPTGVNGGMFYDTTLNAFRCFQNGGWTNCIGSGSSPTIQNAYDNSSSPATVTTSSSSKGVLFKAGASNDSTALFQVQNAGSVALLTVDSVNERLYVGPTAGDTTGALLVLGNKTNTGDPTGVNGAMYYNAAMNMYRCYRGIDGTVGDGSWEPCGLDPIDHGFELSEEFMGSFATSSNPIGNTGLGNSQNGTNTLSYSNGTADRPGIFNIATGGTTANGVSIMMGASGNPGSNTPNSMTLAAGNAFKTAVQPGATTANAILRVGMANEGSSNTQPTAGAWWEAAASTNANWRYCYYDGSTQQCSASSVAVANSWETLEIRINATGAGTSSIDFFITDSGATTKYSVTGATLATGTAVAPEFACFTSTSAGRSCSIDYMQVHGYTSAVR